MADLATCLWFEKDGHLAAAHYTTLFPDSEILGTFRHRDGIPLVTNFVLQGVPYQALNGGPGFKLDQATSICLTTSDQDETDTYWNALLEGGGVPGRSGWLVDRFGLSWQVIPKRWLEIGASADKTGMRRAFKAMLDMDKIDIARMEAAFYGRD